MSNVEENRMEIEVVNGQDCTQDTNFPNLVLHESDTGIATSLTEKKDSDHNFCISNDKSDISVTLNNGSLSENRSPEKNFIARQNTSDSVDNASEANRIVDVLENQKVTEPEENDLEECKVLVSSVDPSEVPVNHTVSYELSSYRCDELSSSDDESSSSSSELDSSDCSDTFLDEIHEKRIPRRIPHIKFKGELDLDDLPLIEDLRISVKESDLEKIGEVHAIVDKLVVVQSMKDQKALNLDSVLFLSPDKPLGRIFDVLGPVVQPFYTIRFNSTEHIIEKCVSSGADVYFAPDVNDITSYIFVDELIKQKGSDASWKDNKEPPEEYLDFSDDEQERVARRRRQAKNRHRFNSESTIVDCAQVPVSSNNSSGNFHSFSTNISNKHSRYGSLRGIDQGANRLIGPALSFSRCGPISVPRAPARTCYNPMALPRVPNPFQIASPSPQQPMMFLQPQQPVVPMQQRNVSSPIVGTRSQFPNYQSPVFGQIPIMAARPPGLLTPPYPPPVISPAPPLSPIASALSPPPRMDFIRPTLFNPTNIANQSVNTPTNFANSSINTSQSFVNTSIANRANFMRPPVTPPANFMQPSFAVPVNFSRPSITNTTNIQRPLISSPTFNRSPVPSPNFMRQPVISPPNFAMPSTATPINFRNQFAPFQTNNSVLSHQQLTPNASNIWAQNQNLPPDYY